MNHVFQYFMIGKLHATHLNSFDQIKSVCTYNKVSDSWNLISAATVNCNIG